MKLLHVYAGPFPTNQGTQTLIAQTLRLLSARGHDVHLLCYNYSDFKRSEPFTIHRITDFPKFTTVRSGLNWKKLVLDLSLSIAFRRLTHNIQFDVICPHHYEALAACMNHPFHNKPPVVFHSHALFSYELDTYVGCRLKTPAKLFGKAIDATLPRLASKIVTLSSFMKERLENFGIPADQIEVCRPPYEAFQPKRETQQHSKKNNEQITARYFGNLDGYQGIENLLNVARRLKDLNEKNIKIEICTTSNIETLTQQIRELQLEPLISVRREPPWPQAAQLLADSDIVIIPRHLPGGVPIKLINALMLGRPVIMDFRLTEELTHEKNVFGTDMTNPNQAANDLLKLVNIPYLRQQISKEAYKAAEKFHSPAQYIQKLEKIYTQLS